MNEDVSNDLKQFISVTISQQLKLQTNDLRNDIQKMEKRLSGQIYDLSESVADAISRSNDEVDGQLKDHEARINTLETKNA